MTLLLAWAVPAVHAEDWMFKRSYYSHDPPPGVQPTYPLPESRSAYRPAYYREAFGLSIRSAYRTNNYVIQSGNRFDRTYYREGYVEINP
ncbi:MAG TPA: hypothetical protein VFG20_10720 [Planctomycetaceae bacterium]|nr:hypothetical protein [Planctomycetaceae bacterium]